MIKEEGKYYSVMGVSRKPGAAAADGREISYRYGRGMLESKDPVLKEYLIKEEEQLEQIMSGLSVSETESARRRMEELKLELAYNKEAQDAMR